MAKTPIVWTNDDIKVGKSANLRSGLCHADLELMSAAKHVVFPLTDEDRKRIDRALERERELIMP